MRTSESLTPDNSSPNSSWTADWQSLRRILCIRLDGMGDLMMTTPALAAIRETHPNCHLTLMTSSAGATVASLLPGIDEVMVYDAPWLKATVSRESSQPEYMWFEEIRDRYFDAAIIFTVYSQNPLPTAMMAYMADIPLRLAHCRENPYQLLTHYLPEQEPEQFIRHEAQRQLDLVASIGCTTPNPRLRINVSQKAEQSVVKQLKQLGLSTHQNWIVLHAGASAPSRRYPPEQFAQVTQSLAQKGITAIFTGTPSEQNLVESIRQQVVAPSLSLAGQLDLSEMTALLAAAPLLLSNNTGPVHLAAAVGTPVVDLYALTNVQHTPWQVPSRLLYHDVDCRLCYKSICPEGHHRCLRLITPEQVVTAVLDLLSHPSSHEPSNPIYRTIGRSRRRADRAYPRFKPWQRVIPNLNSPSLLSHQTAICCVTIPSSTKLFKFLKAPHVRQYNKY